MVTDRESTHDLFGSRVMTWLWYVVVLMVIKLCYLFAPVRVTVPLFRLLGPYIIARGELAPLT